MGDGEYNGSKALMDDVTAKAAIDFLIRESKNRRNLEVDFFGGEPLLNFDVIKNTVKYARSIEKSANKNFRFTLTTNGILIDDEVKKSRWRDCRCPYRKPTQVDEERILR